jgi:hypothetical protein
MAMAEILDSVRRIIYKWVNTSSRINLNVTRGDTVISVQDSRRFNPGDQVMLKNSTVYETALIVDCVDTDAMLVTLTTPVLNDWTIAENTVLIKTINEQFVQGIYIGDPDVISRFPAITVNGLSRSSEWLTLESTKERYQIEVTIYVKESTHEEGYRFLMEMTDVIQRGLKYNIMPLVSEYNLTSLARDITKGDLTIYIDNRSLLDSYRRIIIEDPFETQEVWVTALYDQEDDPSQQAARLSDCAFWDFNASNTTIIVPTKHVYNSWPDNIEYGSIHKGELLKAAKISWFAEEEEMQWLRRNEPKLR